MPKTPIPGAKAPAVPAIDPEALTPDQVDALIAQAIGSTRGEKFTLGGVERTREFLRIDAEQDLGDLIIDLIKRSPPLELSEIFMYAIRELRTAAVIILADLEEPDVGPEQVKAARERADKWVRETRGITTTELIDLVLAQVALNRLGLLLGKLLTASGLIGQLAGGSRPGT